MFRLRSLIPQVSVLLLLALVLLFILFPRVGEDSKRRGLRVPPVFGHFSEGGEPSSVELANSEELGFEGAGELKSQLSEFASLRPSGVTSIARDSNARIVDAFREGRPVDLSIGSRSALRLSLSPRRVFADQAAIRLRDGSVLLDPHRDVHVFAGSVAAVAPDPSRAGQSEITTATDTAADSAIPESGLTGEQLLAGFDATVSNLSIIGDQMVMALSNDDHDRILLRRNPETSAMEMRYEPREMMQTDFGQCQAQASDTDLRPTSDDLFGEAFEEFVAKSEAAVDPAMQEKYNEWQPLDGVELMAIETNPGSEASRNNQDFLPYPPPFGEKYHASLQQLTYVCDSGPGLLTDGDNPTEQDISSMLCRLLLSLESVNEIYERNAGVEMQVAELVVRTNDTTGEIGIGDVKNNRGGYDKILAHGVIYGWGGGGYASGSFFNISSWVVGIAHELGHILGIGHTNGNGLMGPAGGPQHFWGTWGNSTGTSAHTLYQRLMKKQIFRAGIVDTAETLDGLSDNVGHGNDTKGFHLRNPVEMAYANKDAFTTAIDTPVEFDPLSNDDRRTPYSYFYNEDLLIEEVGRVVPNGAGTVEIIDSGRQLRFTPASGFEGGAFFNYTLRGSVGNNGRGWLTRAPVTVTVGNAESDPTSVTLAPGEDRWIWFSGTINSFDYPTMASQNINGWRMLLRAHPDATGSEVLTGSVKGNPYTLTVNYSGAGRSAIDDLRSTDGSKRLRFNPLGNDEVAGHLRLDYNISRLGAVSLDTATDKITDYAREYRLLSATLDTPSMGTLDIERSHRVYPDGTWGMSPTGFLIFTPAAGASGYADISYTAEDSDGTVYSGTSRILVGIAEVTSPARDYTILRRDMSLLLETQQLPASGVEFSGTSTLSWSVVNKPIGSQVTLENATSAQALARFSLPGRYRLRLEATDNGHTKTIERWVMVEDIGAPYEGGSELAPWIDASQTALAGWNDSRVDTSRFGIVADDDGFANLVDLAPLGTASWVVGDAGYDAHRLSRPHASPSYSSVGVGSELVWELDFGGERELAWVDLILIFESAMLGYTLEFLADDDTVLQTSQPQNVDVYSHRVRVPYHKGGGGPGVRKLRLTKDAQASRFQVVQVRAIGRHADMADLTIGATPSQSTTLLDSTDYDAWKAIDGISYAVSRYRSATDESAADDWWLLDLPEERELQFVTMLFQSSFANRTLTALDAGGNPTWQTTLDNTDFHHFDAIPAGIMVKQLRIEVAPGATNSLVLLELDAYGSQPAALTYQWRQVSGPGSAGFADATALDTEVTFPTSGSYLLRLVVDDGFNKTARDFTIDYHGASTAPVGNGIEDIYTYTGGTHSVDLFTAFDDGETVDSGLTFSILGVSDSSLFASDPTGTIADPANFSLVTANGVSGSSTVTVRATDGDGKSTDLTFTITTENQPPTAPQVVDIPVLELAASGTQIADLASIISDPDHDVLSFTVQNNYNNGYTAVASDGKITLTGDLPVINEGNGLSLIPVHVSDGVNQPVAFSLRIVIQDENRPPGIDAQRFYAGEAALPGYPLFQPVLNSQNESNETYTWQILSGDAGSDWSINADTGELTLEKPLSKARNSQYLLQVRVTDSGSPAKSTDTIITIDVEGSGILYEEQFDGIASGGVTDLTGNAKYPDAPDLARYQEVNALDFGDVGKSNFGRRVRGWLVAPMTGEYHFHISSDDSSEFHLSTDDSAANASKQVELVGYGGYQDFSRNSSAAIALQAGQRYYYEVLHAEGGGGDHVSVAWTLPGAATPALIDGQQLERYPDLDADGLDDWWEVTYLGNLSFSGADDPDNDGLSNSEEALLRLHPQVDSRFENWKRQLEENPPLFYTLDPLPGNQTRTVDLSALKGDATFEFFVDAEDLGQSATHLLDGNGWSLRFEQWNNRNVLGVTRYGWNDYTFSPVDGQSVASPYGALTHLVFVQDSVNNQTRMYVNGTHVGNIGNIPNFSVAGVTLGYSSLRDDADTGIYAFAAYNHAISDEDIGDNSNAGGTSGDGSSNGAPLMGDQLFSTTQQAAVGGTVGAMAAIDPDSGDTLSYQILSGNDAGLFAIDSASGQITIVGSLAVEAGNQYQLEVEATDDASTPLSTTATATIDILDSTPSITQTSLSASEAIDIGTIIGHIGIQDHTPGEIYSVSITGGSGASLFAIDDSGTISTTAYLDYETATSHQLLVSVVDSGDLATSGTITITITDATLEDTDRDGYKDALEAALLVDPMDPNVTPGALYSDLYAWWRLEEGAGTTAVDSSGNERHGTLTNGPTWGNGARGGGVTFDGVDDHILYSETTNIPAYTIALWAKIDSVNTTNNESVFSNYNGSTGFQIQTNGGNPGNYQLAKGSDYNFGQVSLDWKHIALVYDGTHAILYYDGVKISEDVVTGMTAFNRLNLGRNRGGAWLFDGDLDEFMMWSRPLSDTEVASVYQLRNAPDINDGTFSLSRPAAADSVIGSPTLSSAGAGGLAYSIVQGEDSELFAVSSSGELSLAQSLSVSGPDFYDVVVEVEDSAGATDRASIRINVAATTGFGNWVSQTAWRFGDDISPEGDSDGDGLSNLEEYAYGRDPLVGDGDVFESIAVVEDGGALFFEVIYQVSTSASDVTITLETADDSLGPWTVYAPDHAELSSQDMGNNRTRVTIRKPALLDKEFMRLSVSL